MKSIEFDGKLYGRPDDLYLAGFRAGRMAGETLVRCRDCAKYATDDCPFMALKRDRDSARIADNPFAAVNMCVYYPNGYCAWGERDRSQNEYGKLDGPPSCERMTVGAMIYGADPLSGLPDFTVGAPLEFPASGEKGMPTLCQ